jgi:hypothetical protein
MLFQKLHTREVIEDQETIIVILSDSEGSALVFWCFNVLKADPSRCSG